MQWTHFLTVSTTANYIYNGNCASTLTLTAQPPSGGCWLKVTAGGAVTLSISDGTSSETLTFTGAREKYSQYEYVPTLQIICSDYTGTVSLKIESVDASGNSIQLSSTNTNYPCNFVKQSTSGTADVELIKLSGSVDKNMYIVRCPTFVPLNLNDEFSIVGRTGTFKVISEPDDFDVLGTNTQVQTKFKTIRIR